MKIISAEFIKSAVKPDQYPKTGLPEIAFAGRSNVGKSSLINTLLGRKKLAQTSATPGKTRLINFFTVNGKLSFVDLPGYGFAKVSRAEQEKWGPMIETYLRERVNLRLVVSHPRCPPRPHAAGSRPDRMAPSLWAQSSDRPDKVGQDLPGGGHETAQADHGAPRPRGARDACSFLGSKRRGQGGSLEGHRQGSPGGG